MIENHNFTVMEEKGKTLEEVVDKYLSEHICRSLVQVSIVSIDGKAKHCHNHDLMREVILSITTEFNFCQVLEKEGSSFHGKSRRLSINNYGDEFLKAEKSQVLDDQSWKQHKNAKI
uniref:Disease resistance protein winged helix domain-containing protein n=1 Tax=Quercus lobata TaxID=97700 RepID=A0A7N2LKI6_QUELO